VASPAPLVAETFERHDSGVKERKRQNWLGGKYSIYATDAAVLGDAIFNKILYGSKESRLDKDAIDVADIEKVINDPKFRVVLDEEVVPTNRLLIELNNIKKAAQKYGATTGEWFKGPMLKRDDLRKFYCEEDGSFPGSCVPSVTTKKTQEYRGRKS
jgi:hypothetical protein